MSWPTLYLDMDGVLADFDAATHARGQTAMGDFYVKKHPKDWSPEEKAHSDGVNKLMLDHDFWSGIPPFPGVSAFYHHTLRLWPGKVAILTALPNNPIAKDIALIKQVWCWKYLGVYPRDVITTERHLKASYAQPGKVLVDDLERNCAKFIAAGAHAVQHTSFPETITALRRHLNV